MQFRSASMSKSHNLTLLDKLQISIYLVPSASSAKVIRRVSLSVVTTLSETFLVSKAILMAVGFHSNLKAIIADLSSTGAGSASASCSFFSDAFSDFFSETLSFSWFSSCSSSFLADFSPSSPSWPSAFSFSQDWFIASSPLSPSLSSASELPAAGDYALD